jgi:hypothetical protein
MNRNKLIANRLREVLLNGYWVANTNYREQLSGITKEQAVQKVGTLNTIVALTFHINYYLKGLIPVFEGGALEIRDKFSFDLPPIHTEQDWQNLVNELLGNAEIFASHVEQMPEAKLDDVFVDEQYGTWLRNIEAMIEHCYYHLGQISLIRKLTAES